MNATRSVHLRRVVASLASSTLALILLNVIASASHRGAERLVSASLIAAPLLAALLIWSRRLGAQLLARATWWSLLLGGALGATLGSGADARIGCTIVLCCTGALLATGRSGLDQTSGHFQPVAFRATLIASLVLAMADTGAMLWFGVFNAVLDRNLSVILIVPLMIAGVIGLLRLRTWGLALNLASNVVVAALALTRVLELPPALRALFVATAIVQLLIPVPMLVTIFRGRAPHPPRWGRAGLWTASAVIAAIAGLSVYAAFVHGAPLFRI